MRNKSYSCIIFGCGGYYEKMFDGVDVKAENQYCFRRLCDLKERNRIIDLLYRLTNSRFVRGEHIKKRLEEFWFRHEYDSKKVNGHKKLFIFLQNNEYSHNLAFLKSLRKKYPDGKLVFWLTNSLETYKENICFIKDNYDYTLTFSQKDAQEHNFLFHEWCYSAQKSSNTPESDVFFCGWDKGRRKLLEEIYTTLTQKGIKCDFTILSYELPATRLDGIKYTTQYVSYDIVFERMKNSRCLLEIMPGKQDNAPTLRWAEAIALSKKMLTNNIGMNQNYMNSTQLQVFTSVKDIDFEWIKNISEAAYVDADIISPQKFVSDLISQVWNEDN